MTSATSATSPTFAATYGPWALVAGASDGLGAAFAKELAGRGVNVVLLARRQAVLDRVASDIESQTSSQTRTLAIDLADPGDTLRARGTITGIDYKDRGRAVVATRMELVNQDNVAALVYTISVLVRTEG